MPQYIFSSNSIVSVMKMEPVQMMQIDLGVHALCAAVFVYIFTRSVSWRCKNRNPACIKQNLLGRTNRDNSS